MSANFRLLMVCSLLTSATVFGSSVALAAKTSATHKTVQHKVLSDSELIEALRAAKVVDASYSLTARQTDGEVFITTQVSPDYSENDTKALSVLISKAALDLLPQSVLRSKVEFRNLKNGSVSSVVINRTEIESYNKRQIDEKKLLGSLELEKAGRAARIAASAPAGGAIGEGRWRAFANQKGATINSVVDGPRRPYRFTQLQGIQMLESEGANVTKLRQLFAAQEKLAETGQTRALNESLNLIHSMIQSQREALVSARKTENGGFISAPQQLTQEEGKRLPYHAN